MPPKTLEQIAKEHPGEAFPGTSVVEAKPLTKEDREAIARVAQQRREAEAEEKKTEDSRR